MAGSALRRLMAEHKQLSQNPPDGKYDNVKQEDIMMMCLVFRNRCRTEHRGQLLRVGGGHHRPHRDLL